MQKTARTLSLIGAGAIAGGILAGTLSANAATPATSAESTSTTSSASSSSSAGGDAPANQFGSSPVRADEQSVASTLASTLTRKAQAKTGGTVYRVETDAGDGTYEAHVKKSDGSLVTVTFDSAGNITAVEDGMGEGDPAPAGAPSGGPTG
jgi:hypothetical protein